MRLPYEVMTEYSPSGADSVIAREARFRSWQGSFFYPCGKAPSQDRREPKYDSDTIADISINGFYTFVKTAGPAHLSLADRGLTFATNRDRGVCLVMVEPVRGIDPFGLLRHPNLTYGG